MAKNTAASDKVGRVSCYSEHVAPEHELDMSRCQWLVARGQYAGLCSFKHAPGSIYCKRHGATPTDDTSEPT